tara:strand:- start:257 stop:427 length:171 start_codon:yes stop_codon:yes gene_type:complete
MIELLLASILTCAESEELISNIRKNPRQGADMKEELIETIKLSTQPECYEGSERNS